MNSIRDFSMDNSAIITVASWEERFILGLDSVIEREKPKKLLMYYLDQYQEWSQSNRGRAKEICKSRGVVLEEHMLKWADPVGNWRSVREHVAGLAVAGVTVDLSTMPREVIWYVLWLCEWKRYRIKYVYHRPKSYNADWLSRDPGRPRLVVKMSGISLLGARTVLLVLAGFDPERTGQLIQFFEPVTTYLGLQQGDGDAQNDARMDAHAGQFVSQPGIETFQLNAYGPDWGEAAIITKLKPYLESHNVLVTSLGPKMSALALYRVQRAHPQVGLVYAPSREYNRNYSSGLDQAYEGEL
jgi:hypothetical protein